MKKCFISFLKCTVWQSWARAKAAATKWPCLQARKLLIIALCIHLLWQLNLDTEAFTFFTVLLVIESLLRCPVVVVAKLKNCRVPSPADWIIPLV